MSSMLLRAIAYSWILNTSIMSVYAREQDYFIGVDVGTSSARAGVFQTSGEMVGTASYPIQMFRPKGKPDYYQQSSDDIWQAVCKSVNEAMEASGVEAACVKGIGFDATCSLVVLDKENKPISVSPDGDSQKDTCENIIVWLDHRANAQAAAINKSGHKALRCIGGTISPEHEVPKMLWLKQNLPKAYRMSGKMFDLGDYLAFRATGKDVRSLCTTGCKWALDSLSETGNSQWDLSFFKAIGLGDLPIGKIGEDIRDIGTPVDGGIEETAAEELGLLPGTPVGVGMIDAHAGGMGCLGATLKDCVEKEADDETMKLAVEESIVLIAGTSTCHMISSSQALFVDKVWGPFWSAVVPGFWLQEGGQSVTGALLDHLIENHPKYPEAKALAEEKHCLVYDVLYDVLRDMAATKKLKETELGQLTEGFHMTPDFAGNRGPIADPNLKGSIVGLALSATIEDLALLYLAGIQAVVYGTRHIMEQATDFGHKGFKTVYVCGGLSKQKLFLQEQADALGLELKMPRETEAVLLGSAMAGAAASGIYDSVFSAMASMGAVKGVISPNLQMKPYHDKKFRIFKEIIQDQLKYRSIMEEE